MRDAQNRTISETKDQRSGIGDQGSGTKQGENIGRDGKSQETDLVIMR